MLTVIEQSSVTPIEQEGFSASEMVSLGFSKIFNFNYNENESESSSKLQSFQRYVKSSMATTIGKFYLTIILSLNSNVFRWCIISR